MRSRRFLILVAAVAVLACVAFALKGALASLLQRETIVDVEFRDARGLRAGDPVLLLGVDVGRVRSVEIAPHTSVAEPRVRVKISLPNALTEHLRVDSQVTIAETARDPVCVLIQGGRGPRFSGDKAIVGSHNGDLNDLTARLDGVAANAERISGAVSRILEDLETNADIALAVSELAAFPKTVREDLIPVREQLEDVLSTVKAVVEENRIDLRHTLTSLRETTEKTRSFADKLLVTPEMLEQTLLDLRNVANKAHDVLSESRPEVKMILSDLRETSTNTATLTAEIRRRPWRILYRPSEDELKSTDLYDSAWAFNLGATELNRSLQELIGHLNAQPSDQSDAELELAYEKVRAALQRQKEAEEVFWARLRDRSR